INKTKKKTNTRRKKITRKSLALQSNTGSFFLSRRLFSASITIISFLVSSSTGRSLFYHLGMDDPEKLLWDHDLLPEDEFIMELFPPLVTSPRFRALWARSYIYVTVAAQITILPLLWRFTLT
ncbi:hypothetical protein PV325_000340, partial [Microctonus aethiopoides]